MTELTITTRDTAFSTQRNEPFTQNDARACGKTTARDQHSSNGNGPLLSLFKAKSFQQHYQPESTILLHGHAADAIYLVVSGTIRCCTISEDGRRQIFRFAKKGEFVGVSDYETWHFTAEAVDHVIVKSIPRATVEQALAVNIPLRQEIRSYVRSQLECRERQLLAMVTRKAPERLFEFLSEFAASRPGDGYIALPMCRRDIADHLGMSVETVSRAFGDLKSKGRVDLACAEKFRICSPALCGESRVRANCVEKLLLDRRGNR